MKKKSTRFKLKTRTEISEEDERERVKKMNCWGGKRKKRKRRTLLGSFDGEKRGEGRRSDFITSGKKIGDAEWDVYFAM